MAGVNRGGRVAAQGVGPIQRPAPEALLWFNPFAAEYDVICGASDGYGGWCSRLNTVTNGAISVTGFSGGGVLPTPQPGFGVDNSGGGVIAPVPAVPAAPVKVRAATAPSSPSTTRARRCPSRPRTPSRSASGGTRSGRAACGRGRSSPLVLILASIQLVSPTRRWRLAAPSGAVGAPLMRLRMPRLCARLAAPVDPAIVPADPRARRRPARSIRISSRSGRACGHRRRLWIRRIVRRAWIVASRGRWSRRSACWWLARLVPDRGAAVAPDRRSRSSAVAACLFARRPLPADASARRRSRVDAEGASRRPVASALALASAFPDIAGPRPTGGAGGRRRRRPPTPTRSRPGSSAASAPTPPGPSRSRRPPCSGRGSLAGPRPRSSPPRSSSSR